MTMVLTGRQSKPALKYKQLANRSIFLVAVLALMSFLCRFGSVKFFARSPQISASVQAQNSKMDLCLSLQRTENVTTAQFRSERQLVEFLEGPGLLENNGNALIATCKFQYNNHSRHFPHAMQQLYRCHSWWQANPDKQPWLVFKSPQNAFVGGFLTALRDVFNVTIVRLRHNLKVVRPKVEYAFGSPFAANFGYAMQSPRDAIVLRDSILHHYDLLSDRTGGCHRKPSVVGASVENLMREPSIGILNRSQRTGRRFLSDSLLRDAIRERFGLTVHMMTFDDKNFLQQVQFMSETDILLSPHGAQLTSIPFLPPCARMMEFFPVGYLVPEFFGTLAAASDVSYAYLYTGQDRISETATWMKDAESRQAARLFPVCPNLETVMDNLEEQIAAWRTCCRGKN
jgi:hypothetical protein